MRTLFVIDKKNYIENGSVGYRPSVRGIIIKDDKIALIYSKKFNYYKFPGGGIDEGESHIQTLIREVKEESGLDVKPNTIKEFGYVQRIEKGMIEDIFVQENFYYLCETDDTIGSQSLDDYEDEEGFELQFVTPQYAIDVNEKGIHDEKSRKSTFNGMLERDTRVLKMIIEELM